MPRKPNGFAIPYKYVKNKKDKIYMNAGVKITKPESEAERVKREGRV